MLTIIECNGVRIVEGSPGVRIIGRSQDVANVLEVCLSNRSRAALLYPENLPDGFFDLSSGAAGDILQKVQHFGIRLAVVAPAGSVAVSTHFNQILNRHLNLSGSRDEAIAWLTGS